MPGAPPETLFDRIRRGCKRAYSSQGSVTINQEALQQVAAEVTPSAVQATLGSRFPVKCDDVESQVNLLALYHLMDVGSGYDPLLLAANKRDARETIQYGILGAHLTGSRLDAAWSRGFSGYHVHNLFGIEAKVDTQLQPGITISKNGPLAPLCEALRQLVTGVGGALEAAGAPSLGAWVLEQLAGDRSAAGLVGELVDSFAGFQDQGLFTAQAAAAGSSPEAGGSSSGGEGASQTAWEVVFCRKAQLLALDLATQLAGSDSRFEWADLDQLTADSGPVVAAVLQKLGVLQLSPDLASKVEQQEVLTPGSEERSIRAAVVVAMDQLAAAVAAGGGQSHSSMALSQYLAAMAGPGGKLQGQVKPFLCTNTNAY